MAKQKKKAEENPFLTAREAFIENGKTMGDTGREIVQAMLSLGKKRGDAGHVKV